MLSHVPKLGRVIGSIGPLYFGQKDSHDIDQKDQIDLK